MKRISVLKYPISIWENVLSWSSNNLGFHKQKYSLQLHWSDLAHIALPQWHKAKNFFSVVLLFFKHKQNGAFEKVPWSQVPVLCSVLTTTLFSQEIPRDLKGCQKHPRQMPSSQPPSLGLHSLGWVNASTKGQAKGPRLISSCWFCLLDNSALRLELWHSTDFPGARFFT